MIGTVFGPKRRRTSSFGRREDGVSYLDLINEGELTQGREELVGGVHKFARNSSGHNMEESSLNMAQEALGSDKGINLFQSMKQRRALTCSKSVRWYSKTSEEGKGNDF